MRTWVQWVAILTLILCPTCGGGGGGGGEAYTPCGQLLGEELVQPLLDVHTQQVMIEARILTVPRTHLQTLGIQFPNALPIDPGQTLNSLAGSYCGGAAGVATSVVGGAVGDIVVLPQGTSGSQGLPRVENAPVIPTNGAQVFPTMPGPGVFDVARQSIQFLDDSGFVPAGAVLPQPLIGAGGNSLLYALTDDAGHDQFMDEVRLDAATRIVSAPKVVTLDNQEALIFVGTEIPFIQDLTSPMKEAVLAVNPDAQRVEVGVTLHLTPSIPQSGLIQMEIRPESVALVVDSPQMTIEGANPVVARIPVFQPSDQKLTVLANDGNTVILGGLRDDATQDETTGLPFLSELPLVGGFLREDRQLNLKDDLIVLIRAHILREKDSGP